MNIRHILFGLLLVPSLVYGQAIIGGSGGTGVTDGDKGDIAVSASGATYTVQGATNPVFTGATMTNTHQSIVAGGNLGATETLSWTAQATFTGTLNDNCALTLTDAAIPNTGDEVLAIVLTQDGTGARTFTIDDEAGGTDYTFTAFQINPRASAQSTLYLRRIKDSTAIEVVGPEALTVQFTVVDPNGMADAVRDACLVWHNDTGKSMYVTKWEFWAGTDNTTLNLETTTSTGATNATIDAVEIATDGTGLFTASDTTITAGTITSASLIFLDFDDTDTPTYVKGTLTLWP